MKKNKLKGVSRADKKLAKQKIKNLKSANQTPMKRRFRKKKSIASVLFPGVAPEEYLNQQEVRFVGQQSRSNVVFTNFNAFSIIGP